MYYRSKYMIMMDTQAASTTAQPTNPVAGSNVIKSGQSNTSSGTKLSANRKTAPVLPASNMSGISLSGSGSVEIKAGGADANQEGPLVALDSEPPPKPGPGPLFKPVSGGALKRTAISLPPP